MLNDEARICFIIMPYGARADPARHDVVEFDTVYDRIIKVAVEDVNERRVRLKAIRSDEIPQAGLIHERMIRLIAEADVAIVDITSLNPNVFYELGVRHALRDRVTVVLRRKGTTNPFNIAGMATIEYDVEPEAAEAARKTIADYIANGLMSGTTDSLVHAMLPGLNPSVPPEVIGATAVEEYVVPHAPGRRIGIVTGNLRNVNLSSTLIAEPITIWVSSENINMHMARPYDNSISGLIRYLGATKDDTGRILLDTIALELAAVMHGGQLVNPGEVVATGPGCLADTHKVQRIYHAASVYGVVGTGFHTIAGVEQCITNALARADREYAGARARPSILFPLLGTGTARSDITSSARRQMGAALDYLQGRAPATHVERVYFLAPTKNHLAGMRVALAELGVVKPWPDCAPHAPDGWC